MDFETLASQEITTLIGRLTKAAADSRDQAVGAAQAAHAEELRTLAADHTAAFEQINNALLKAQAEHERALRQLQTDHDAALVQIRSEHDQRLAASEQERAQAVQALDALSGTHEAALNELTRTHEATITQLTASQDAAMKQLTASHESAVQELTTSHAAIVAELNDAQQQMAEHARRQLAVVTGENSRLMIEFDALEKKYAELADAPKGQDTRAPLLAHLNAVSGHIAASASTTDVFVNVAQGLTYDFRRTVVFELHEQRLDAVHQHGFGDKIPLDRLALTAQDKSVVARALQTSEVRRYDGGGHPVPAFAGTPATMLTLPIAIGGKIAAVVYADDGGAAGVAPVEDCTTLATLLQQQAALRLGRLTIELAEAAELRAYARMLVEEAEYVFNADLLAGKADHDRMAHLQENVRCARQIFTQRVTSHGPAAVSLLDDVITERLHAQSGSAFANDLGQLLLQGDLESTAA